MRKRSLGRGLSELLSGGSGVESSAVVEIPIEEIRPNPRQPRGKVDEEGIEELALSIEAHGVLQPVICRRRGDGYELVAGERRWRAAQRAGLSVMPCLVQDIDDGTSLEIALIENLQRDDLNELELADGYKCLLEDFGLTQEELGKRIGKSRSTVTNTLRLLDLPVAVREMIREGRLSAGHGRALLSLSGGEEEVRTLAAEVIRKTLSVRDVESLVREYAGAEPGTAVVVGERTKAGAGSDPHLVEAEERLQSILAAKVQIKPRKKGGTIRIQYYDDEDLSRIVDEIDAEGRLQ
jgi:ParB family transcriptional regulator, chromosome partitioning protein